MKKGKLILRPTAIVKNGKCIIEHPTRQGAYVLCNVVDAQLSNQMVHVNWNNGMEGATKHVSNIFGLAVSLDNEFQEYPVLELQWNILTVQNLVHQSVEFVTSRFDNGATEQAVVHLK